ncbi:MAG: DUF115 domain-containing protein [Verrucomicrobia bacterium]|nr:DUF115 domain-containing protein [Verrucomicrobiota bacterium]
MSIFEKNLALLFEKAPDLAWRIQTSSVATSRPPYEEVEIPKRDVVYLFGLGAYPKGQCGTLVLLEHDVGRWKGWLSSRRATYFLNKKEVLCAYFDPENPNDPLFPYLYSYFSTLKVAVMASAEYRKKYPEIACYLHLRITGDSAASCRLVDEYKALCHRFYANFYKNLRRLPEAVWGTKLFGKFEGVPAIICGAGPSLDRNVALLSTLKNKALIFAGGSALNAVSCNGVLPHFGAGIDPHFLQFERLRMNQAFQTAMFFRSRWYEGSLPFIQGTPLYLNGSGGQMVASRAEAHLGIEGEALDEGFNVVNFTVEVARSLGCNPLIFVGLDLAYTQGAQYAQGVLYDVAIDEEKLLSPTHYYDVPLERDNIYGEKVYTHWKWLAEAKWIGDYQMQHSQLTMINCTEGGIGFPGIPHKTLEQVARSHLRRSYPLEEWLHSEIQMASKHKIEKERVDSFTAELESSLRRCEEHLSLLEQEWMEMEKRVDQLPPHLRSGRAALLEVELEGEMAYEAILSVFSYVFQSQMNRQLVEGDLLTTLRLEREKFSHLRDAVCLNLRLLTS